VRGDTNDRDDVFVRDRVAGTTTRVSVASDGTQADDRSLVPAISADGRFVAFGSDAENLVKGSTAGVSNVFVHDRFTRTTSLVSVATDGSPADAPLFDYHPGISADGRFVAFTSLARNLVPGDTNQVSDAFVRDRWAASTRRASVSDTGAQANGFSYEVAISAEGLDTVFISGASNLVRGDTNGVNDVFVRRRSN
jgi:Tol biopolymer transport system component